MATYKVVDADKLDTDLKSVADSIRAKGGTTENLDFPEDFVSAVGNIETGSAKEEQEKTVEITENGTTEVVADEGKSMSKVTVNTNVAFEGDIGKPYIDTSKMNYFFYFFNKNPLLLDDIDKIDTSNGTMFGYMFFGCSNLTTIPQLDTSNGTNFNNMFQNCSSLQTIPQLDVSKGTDFSYMFNGCSNLTTIPQLDTSNGTNFNNMFNNCRKITDISIDTSEGTNFNYMCESCYALETVSLTTAKSNLSPNTFQRCEALQNITIGEGWAVNIYLQYSNNLTVESLHGMIENLADLTGSTAKTFQIGATNLAKIDEEYINMLKAKNWNYS